MARGKGKARRAARKAKRAAKKASRKNARSTRKWNKRANKAAKKSGRRQRKIDRKEARRSVRKERIAARTERKLAKHAANAEAGGGGWLDKVGGIASDIFSKGDSESTQGFIDDGFAAASSLGQDYNFPTGGGSVLDNSKMMSAAAPVVERPFGEETQEEEVKESVLTPLYKTIYETLNK